jgi:RNA polymerase sigma-70 factor (ECF subfamily)
MAAENPDRHPAVRAEPPPGPAEPQAAEFPQLSREQGVSSDVSSVALDQRLLGTAPAARGVQSAPASLDGLTDAEIMLRVRRGDQGAFEFLVQKFRRPMISFMYRMVRNSAAAEDLAQEVFLRVYRSRETYAANAKFTTWLYRIATNLAVNYARDTRHERPESSVSLDAADPDTGMTMDVADPSLTAEQDLVRRERLAAIRAHVQALPERQRTAVLMHKYQGLDYRQIAEVLQLSESATKSLLFRAYETLRDKLKEFV